MHLCISILVLTIKSSPRLRSRLSIIKLTRQYGDTQAILVENKFQRMECKGRNPESGIDLPLPRKNLEQTSKSREHFISIEISTTQLVYTH